MYKVLRNLQKNIELVNDFSKITGSKVNIQKLIIVLYTCTKIENKIKRRYSTMYNNIMKYLGSILNIKGRKTINVICATCALGEAVPRHH